MEMIRKQRCETSARIIKNAEHYKICLGCLSLLRKSIALCPLCRAYRFDTRTSRVRAHARAAGRRPIALGRALLPRFFHEIPSC